MDGMTIEFTMTTTKTYESWRALFDQLYGEMDWPLSAEDEANLRAGQKVTLRETALDGSLVISTGIVLLKKIE